MNTSTFVSELAKLRFENAFNPYAECCTRYDGSDAPTIRRLNLTLVLEAALRGGVDSIWIARDLGYRGGRRTGLPLTDDAHLSHHAKLYGGLPLRRATCGPTVSERTASVIWRVLGDVGRPTFLWNVFPLHPHVPAEPFSNRCHTRAERLGCRTLLLRLLDALRPNTVVAIGRDAQFALEDLNVASQKVRHPSYGGQSEFLDGIYRCYGMIRPAAVQPAKLL